MATCTKCGRDVPPGEVVEHGGRTWCEDCLMDQLSPTRACDPWAVHAARNVGARATADELHGLEKRLYDLVRDRGEVPKADAPALLGEAAPRVERAFATLRHMELLRARRTPDGSAVYVLFRT